MNYLLDTCLLSEFVKPYPDSAVLAWMQERNETELFVSAMTIAELHRGVEKLPVSRRRSELAAWLQQLEIGFEGRVLSFTQKTAGVWATVCAMAESQGKPIAAFDSIIAATAVEHGFALVTRNIADFSQAPLVLINPWG